MSPTLFLTLPYPPTSNTLYATVNGRRVLTREGRAYKRDVAWLAKQALLQCPTWPCTRETEYWMSWGITVPDLRRDLDNCLKAIGDALTDAGVYPDDSQVMEMHIVKDYQPGQGEVRLAVHVREE